jgi:methionine aminopeptidase
LRFAEEVAMSDVRVAQELMQASKYTLESSREQKEKRRGNYISEIADIIHSLMTKNRYVRYAVFMERCHI